MAIHGIIGDPGAGKTAFATILAIQMAERFAKMPESKRRKIYCSWPVYDDRIGFVESFTEATHLHNAVVFWDEFARLFGRRSFAKNSEEDLNYFRVHRHDGLTLYWIAHAVEDVETKIAQELTTSFWHVRRIFGPDMDEQPTGIERLIGMHVVARQFRARDYQAVTKRTHLRTTTFRLDRMFHKYDSFYIPGARDGTGRRDGRAAIHANAGSLPAHPLRSPDVYAASRRPVTDLSGVGLVRWQLDLAALNAGG